MSTVRFPLPPLALAAALLLPCAVRADMPAPDAPAPSPSLTPKWEAGVLVGGAHVADYPGADQSHPRGLVAPVLVYRGPVLRVDRDGIRGRLLNTSDWEFDLSASAAFNARSNEARRGMPGIDYLFGVGPQLIYKGLSDLPGQPRLHLNARAVMSTDFDHVQARGAVFDPELRWRVQRVAGTATQFSFGVQPAWGSRSLQRYFYEVAPEQARADRPAYAARAGYLGTELKFTLNHRYSSNLSWFAGLRLLSLHGAANTDSPLLRDRSNLNIGTGVLWTPWRSRAVASE